MIRIENGSNAPDKSALCKLLSSSEFIVSNMMSEQIHVTSERPRIIDLFFAIGEVKNTQFCCVKLKRTVIPRGSRYKKDCLMPIKPWAARLIHLARI